MNFDIPENLQADIRIKLEELAYKRLTHERNQMLGDLEKVTQELYDLAIALAENKAYLALQHKTATTRHYLIYITKDNRLKRFYSFSFSIALGAKKNPDPSGTHYTFTNLQPLSLFLSILGICNISAIESRLKNNIL